MKDLKEFDISFIGLKEGMHQFEYKIEKEFFDFFNYDEFYNSEVNVGVQFLKKATMFELSFQFNGWVEINCDVTNERYHQPIETSIDLVVNFGDEFNDENEELLIIPYSEYKINIAQYIYEAIVLDVPLKRIHPGLEDGTLHSEVLEKLKEFEIPEEVEEVDENKGINQDIDPRWNKLKDILIDKNTSNGTS
ncbi:YceD family protein [Lutibacter sp.]